MRLKIEKIAAFAPMPSASDTIATRVTKGVLNSVRSASLRLGIMIGRIDGLKTLLVYARLKPRHARRPADPERGDPEREGRYVMSRARRLANHILRTFRGPMWHGPALTQVLEGVTHEQAAAKPIAGAHSVWELVLHASAWAEIARARVRGERLADPPPEEDWPPVGTTGLDDWQLAIERLRESHRALAAAVRDLSDEALDAKVGELEYTVDVLLHGVIEHSTYHGGQIMILRKAL